MLLVWFIETMSIGALLWIGITQVILPLARGGPLFPFIRSSEETALDHLRDANERVHVEEIENAAARRSAEAERLAGQRNKEE